jgi:hypothetical protein
LVLETVFDTADGRVALIDFMLVGRANSSVIRLVRGRRGKVAMQLHLALRFGLRRHCAVGDAATRWIWPERLIGLMLQGSTGGLLGPAITAISLGLVGHLALPEWLGRTSPPPSEVAINAICSASVGVNMVAFPCHPGRSSHYAL